MKYSEEEEEHPLSKVEASLGQLGDLMEAKVCVVGLSWAECAKCTSRWLATWSSSSATILPLVTAF